MSSTTNITLYTVPTPNGHTVSICLEELKAINPSICYDAIKIDTHKNVQKEPWFIKLNPNGRVPIIIDHSRGDFIVFESSAILLYLAHHYDKDHTFWFDSEKEPNFYSEMLQWIFFAVGYKHGGIGPMQGQASHFKNWATEDIPYAKNRYIEETKRLYGVLEIRLNDRDFLVGPGKGKLSLADLKSFGWVRYHSYVGIESMEQFPGVKAWLARIEARPGVQAGIKVPA